ncbi:MAG: SMC family ATPase, partial [Chloroflexi bacterium]
QSVRQAGADAEKLAAAQAQQAELRQQLDSRNFAADALANLAVVEAELKKLGYDSAAHDSARQQVAELHHFEDEARALAHAGERIAQETKRLERDRARHTRLTEQAAADQTKIAELEQETAEFAGLSARLNEASRQLDEFQREYRFAQEKVGAAKQKLSHIAYLSKSRSKQDDKLQQVRESLGIFRELQTAFGKKGVQALLIESAIPEIENEANAILSRMTDGRMNIRFETQREAVSSDSTIETLDILISDEAGTRDYELYSGGEAFRINFAIRIAISKVLARRAGARLQTLMIDEGFGTQDAQGRERLVEAINVIQNDFEKLIVITHIDELKDAFPVRIDVWKTPDGSQIAIR